VVSRSFIFIRLKKGRKKGERVRDLPYEKDGFLTPFPSINWGGKRKNRPFHERGGGGRGAGGKLPCFMIQSTPKTQRKEGSLH